MKGHSQFKHKALVISTFVIVMMAFTASHAQATGFVPSPSRITTRSRHCYKDMCTCTFNVADCSRNYGHLTFLPKLPKTVSEGARRTHRAPPPPPPHTHTHTHQPSTMVPKYTLGCHNLTCFPDSHWDALELQPFAQGYPLVFTRALTERRSLMHHLNLLYIIVLLHNGPDVL